ncbi:LPD7 domain-containing protein [Pseudomonas sp. LB3P58]
MATETTQNTGRDDLQAPDAAARGPAFGIMQIDDKPATSLRYERVAREGEVSYNVSFHMGTKSVARIKDLDAAALGDVVGEKNAKAISENEEVKGSLKGESLQNEYGLTPEEKDRRLKESEIEAFNYEADRNSVLETVNLEHDEAALNSADREIDLPEEQNTIEHVPELEQVNVQEALARAAFNRQRDRDQLALDQEKLGQRAEGKRIDVENLSEQALEQKDDNALGERTGATTDYDSQQSTEREKNRQIELMEQVHHQFRVSGPKFHFKDQPGKLAFKDKGERMVSASNDERVAKAMATMAEAKGWKTIKVSGHPDFQKEVWMEASLRGLEVRGFKPSEQDLKLLESRRDRTLNNTVERDVDRERAAPRKPQTRAQEQAPLAAERAATSPAKESTTPAPEQNAGNGKPTPEQTASGALRAYSGQLLEHGPAKYNHDPDEKMNYYVKLNTNEGEKTVWGIDLKRAMAEGKPKVGDEINVEYKGNKIVEVEALKRDDSGKIIGREMIDTPRNEWKVEKSDKHKIVEAVAAKVIDAKVKDPVQREQLRKAIDARLVERAQQGKIPTVKVYDKDAQGPQQDRTGPVVERNSERTR